jgi:hypothetical protein
MKYLLQAAVVAAVSLPLFAQTPAAQPAAVPAKAPAPAVAPAPAKPAAPAPAAVAAPAVAPAGEAEKSPWRADAGGDIRIRQEAYGNIPTIAPGVDDHTDYFRVRTRAWFEVGYEDVSLYARVANEFRHYNGFTPAQKVLDPKNGWKFPDELVLDNLYLDIKNLIDGRLDLRIGRQDLMYGAGRVILEGTPSDGSRTIFFDAVKATVHLTPKSSLDAFVIYNTHDGMDLNVGSLDRDLTRGAAPQITEKGGGLYLTSKEMKELPAELYYVYKRESNDKGTGVVPARDTHTIGARVMPQFGEQLSAEVEGAVQFGDTDVEPDQDILAYMGYAGLTYKPDFGLEGKPFFTAACYYLSGDDNATPGEDNRWNPVWARYPQFSDLMVFAMPAGRWSNLVYPHVEAGIKCPCKHNISVKAGPMYAADEDQLAPRDHSYQGVLATARYDFPLLTGVFGKRGDVFGHVQAEVFAPADAGDGYYADDEVGYFLRWEVSAKF